MATSDPTPEFDESEDADDIEITTSEDDAFRPHPADEEAAATEPEPEGKPGGPTIEQWCSHGYSAETYPGMGYAVVHSDALDVYGKTGIVPQEAIARALREERIASGEEEPSVRAPTCVERHISGCACTGEARSQP